MQDYAKPIIFDNLSNQLRLQRAFKVESLPTGDYFKSGPLRVLVFPQKPLRVIPSAIIAPSGDKNWRLWLAPSGNKNRADNLHVNGVNHEKWKK